MENLKTKVHRDTQKQRDGYRETGMWLNNAAPFQHDIRLPKDALLHVLPIFDICRINGRIENKLNFEILMANLLKNRMRRPVMISLNRNDWKKNRYNVVGPGVITIVHLLHENGFIHLRRGYQKGRVSRVSRIWPTSVLLSYFSELNKQVMYHPPELVILRDDGKRDIEYWDTNYTKKIREILRGVNEVNKIAKIQFGKYQLSGSLIAIYKHDFSLYGRLHTRGGLIHYQRLSGEERSEITINGDNVVELDFCGLHPHLLYADEGIQYDNDPYTVVDERIEVRQFLKHILLTLINSKDEITALRSASKWYLDHHKERELLKAMGITKIKPLIEKIKEVHLPISHYFCCSDSTGLKVMNQEARIALDIVHYFALKQIPILAIHDSFIVQTQYEQELYSIMHNVYSMHTKGFRIKIRKKG